MGNITSLVNKLGELQQLNHKDMPPHSQKAIDSSGEKSDETDVRFTNGDLKNMLQAFSDILQHNDYKNVGEQTGPEAWRFKKGKVIQYKNADGNMREIILKRTTYLEKDQDGNLALAIHTKKKSGSRSKDISAIGRGSFKEIKPAILVDALGIHDGVCYVERIDDGQQAELNPDGKFSKEQQKLPSTLHMYTRMAGKTNKPSKGKRYQGHAVRLDFTLETIIPRLDQIEENEAMMHHLLVALYKLKESGNTHNDLKGDNIPMIIENDCF